MAREHEEVVRRMAAAVGKRDLASFLDLTDPDVEWHSSVSVISEGGAYHGHEGVRQYVTDLGDAFESFEVDLDEVLSVGEVALAVGQVSFRGRASGIEQSEQFGWVIRFEEGRVIHLRAFRDPEAAVAAVGLSQ